MPLPSFTVTGDLSSILGGASDLDVTGMGGTVTFTPNVPEDAFVTWAGELYRVRVASSGFIDDISYQLLANDPGLSITGLQWRVDISPDTFAGNGSMRSFVFDAPADGETVDLATVAPAVHVPASGVAGLTESQLLSLIADSGSDVHDALNAIAGRPLASFYRAAQGLVSGVTVVAPVSGATAATGGLVRWDALANKVRYVGSAMTAYDATYGCNVQAGLGNTALAPICIEFYGNPTDFRLHYYSFAKGDVAVMVDEKRTLSPVNAYHYNGADGDVTLQITQGSAVHHKYRIWIHNTLLKGISVNTGAKLVATQKGVQLAVIGDSMIVGGIPIDNAVAAGVQGMIGAGTILGEFSQRTGIDAWPMGGSGTGYINQSGYSTAGPYGSTARMAALAALPALDAILVWGSANDVTSGGTGNAAVVTAAQTLWAAIKTARSTTPLYVAGVERLGPTNTDYNSLNNALKTAAAADANVDGFIDIYNPGFVYGTGKDGSPASDGNADVFLSTDGAHPTHQGAEYWASNLEKLLGGRIVLPFPSNNLW
jgi:lysophospholipase L1-like esterase